jgi:DNA-binding beta-propeller fold protein YncE
VSDAVVTLRRNATTGALFQAPATNSCVSETGTGGTCTDGKALDGLFSLAVSADGKSVYTASLNSDAVAGFRRNPTSGVLTQFVGPAGKAGCVSQLGTGGACADGKGLEGAITVDVSPDGESVYAGSIGSDAVAVFRRDTASGALFQRAGIAGCVSETGAEACADGKALDEPRTVAVSPDGKNVYVSSRVSSAVAVFARDTTP